MRTRLTRREFLRWGSLAALGSALTSCSGPQRLAEMASVESRYLLPTASGCTPTPTPGARATYPAGDSPGPPELHEARYYLALANGRVQCQVCFRRCVVADGGQGFCRTKVNIGGRYYSLVYGHPSAVQIDPIEKEPAFHMLPGANILCTGTAGCNNRCKFCQNWYLSQSSFEDIRSMNLTPEETVAWAIGFDAVSFTYNEPTVFYEHMFDVARLAKQAGLATLFHTNGGMNEAPLAALLEVMDGVTVDLKAFAPEFYRDVCSSELGPVLRTLQQIHQSGTHLEIVNLVIPGLNDDMQVIRRMCQWIRDTLSHEVPLHFNRFFPAYRLTSLPPTPIETLERAARIADEEGLEYVYIGNCPGHERNSTFCPGCGEKIIQRAHFALISLDVESGKCRFCGRPIPGLWRDA